MKIENLNLLPRERFISEGEDKLSDYELLSIILRTGSRGEDVLTLSRKILEKFGGWKGLYKSGINQLAGEKGIGLSKAVTIKAIFEICRRAEKDGHKSTRISSVEDAFAFLKPIIWNEDREKLAVLILDSKNKVIKWEIAGVGSGNGVVVSPREIFINVIREGGVSLILGHNHPSGDPEPSKADIEFTRRIHKAGEVLGINLLDHIIIGSRDFISMKRIGVI